MFLLLSQVMKAGELRNRLPAYANVVYDIDVKWWSLEGAYAGLVNEKGLTASGEIATNQVHPQHPAFPSWNRPTIASAS